MKARTLGYLAAEAVDGVRKNSVMSLVSVTTVAVSLLILSVFGVIAVNLQHMARTVESQVELVAYLQDGFDRGQRESLLKQISVLDGVGGVTYITREQALDRLRKQFGESQDLLDAVEEENPLRDSIEVKVSRPGMIDQVAGRIRGMQGMEKVVYQRDTVRRLYHLTNALRGASAFLAVVTGLATILIIANTIRVSVFARRREIAIMKLVGATDAFIRWPFLIEGALLGLVGAAVTITAVSAAYLWLIEKISATLPFIPTVSPRPFVADLAKLLVLVGVGVGAVGSTLSVRRHLRV